jgi:hypothetical protein
MFHNFSMEDLVVIAIVLYKETEIESEKQKKKETNRSTSYE